MASTLCDTDIIHVYHGMVIILIILIIFIITVLQVWYFECRQAYLNEQNSKKFHFDTWTKLL